MTPEESQRLKDVQTLLNQVAAAVGRAEANSFEAMKVARRVEERLDATP